MFAYSLEVYILSAENYVSELCADTLLDHSWEAWLLILTDYHAQTSKYILELDLSLATAFDVCDH